MRLRTLWVTSLVLAVIILLATIWSYDQAEIVRGILTAVVFAVIAFAVAMAEFT